MFVTFSCAHTGENNHHSSTELNIPSEYVFSPVTNLAEQVEQTLMTAKTQNKKALFVLGAQWCHDSKGLAKNFATPQMQEILSANYQVLFIDVGYLEKGFEVVKQFNLPIYYGTPTVMVVEPHSAEIMNRANMQKWLSADNVPLNEYVDYFGGFVTGNIMPTEQDQAMQTYLKVIDNFENEQAKRLKEAYGVIGPLLKQYMESEKKEASDEFSNKWEQVRTLRYGIQDDIHTLVEQAKANVAAKSSMPLTLPVYPAFTWE